MRWKDETLLAWVNSNPQDWAQATIRDWHDSPLTKFSNDSCHFVVATYKGLGNIDMATVVGQGGHYAGQTWLDALLCPKYKKWKMDDAIREFEGKPRYYFTNEVNKEDIYFETLDNRNWYSTSGGNHRTVIAKFCHAMATAKTGNRYVLENVNTTRYEFDFESFDVYMSLNEFIEQHGLKITVTPGSGEKTVTQDGATSIERSPLNFTVYDERFGFFSNDLMETLSPDCFKKYADKVINTNGQTSRWEHVRYYWQFWSTDNSRKLIY